MAINLTNTYPVTTPPMTVDGELGSLSAITHRQFRYSTFECYNDAVLQAGVFVTLAPNSVGKNIAKKPTLATDAIYGVSYLNTLNVAKYNTTLGVYEFPVDTSISLITDGDIWMYSESSVTMGGKVFMRHAVDAALTRIGALAGTAGTGLVEVSGARFLQSKSAPGRVVVSLLGII